jgi:RNA polymerase sigma-70 factor (ECF subfamily)
MTPPTIEPAATEPELVRRSTRGDLDAFGELVSRHQRRLWLVCRQYVGEDEAEAASQDAFVKAFTRLASFDGRAAFATWLTRIAINTCLDVLRKRHREGTVVGATDDEEPVLDRVVDDRVDPEERVAQRQAVARLGRIERSLPDGQRAVFRLRFYAQMELEEIADALDVHIGTVKTQLHRAVHRVRTELGELR